MPPNQDREDDNIITGELNWFREEFNIKLKLFVLEQPFPCHECRKVDRHSKYNRVQSDAIKTKQAPQIAKGKTDIRRSEKGGRH